MKGAAVSSTEPESRVGSRFGPYRLMRRLGEGALGEVYQAEDTRKGEPVAVKLISGRLATGNGLWKRMQREAEAAAKLDQPHVVPVYDYGEIDGSVYLATGLIDGTDLASLLRTSGPLSAPRAVAIVRQVAEALDSAHDAGVSHRDVKPENILITDDDIAYLTDFGIAAAAFGPDSDHDGTTPGSRDYLTPERLAGDLPEEEVTPLDDVYALTCVLFESLTGQPPFPADTVQQAVEARSAKTPPRPSRLRPGRIPAAIDQVVAHGLARRQADRYRTAVDMATAAYQALTEPERHQVTRILHRAEAAPAEAAPEKPTAVPAGPAMDDATVEIPLRPSAWSPPQRQWAPPDQVDQVTASPALLPDFTPSSRRARAAQLLRRLRNPALLGSAALAVVGVVTAFGYLITRPSPHDEPAAAPRQTVLSFTGLDYRLAPGGVALDAAGNVYVTSQDTSGQVLKLPADSTTPTTLPVTGLYQPRGIAVDDKGNVYFSDFNNRVVKLEAGSNNQVTLPFGGLDNPEGVAVDSDGNVYVADRGNNLVMKLEAGSNTQIVLPFVGLANPDGVAVDHGGDVYVTDTGNNRVLKLAAGSTQQVVLPFPGIVAPWGIAVDDGGSVYVTERDSNKVVRLGAGALIPNVLPFVDLNTPLAVAVDEHGDVYVADRGNDRVVKVPGGR